MFEDKVDTDKTESSAVFAGFWGKAVVILLLCGISVWAYLVYFPPSTLSLPSFQNQAESELTLTGQDGLYFVELPSMKINLKPNEAHYTFIDAGIVLELSKASDKRDISAVLPRIQDAIHTYLRELTPAELQESGSLYRIKEALLERINFLIAPAHINDVLFKELFVEQGR